MKETSLYRLEVAPLLILPLRKSPFFSYASEKPLPIGSLIAISFGKRSLEGVVFACETLPGTKPLWMKSYSKMIIPAFLTPHQLALAQYISEEYFTSLGKVLKHFLPKKTTALTVHLSTEMLPPLPKLSSTDKGILQDCCILKDVSYAYLDMFSLHHFEHWLAHFMKKMTRRKGQVLIVVPEIVLLPALQKIAKTYFPSEKIVSLHSKLTDREYFHAWEHIRSGEAILIFATRQGLFAPFNNLKSIVIFEEQDDGYKQWNMSPRYDARKVAKELAICSSSKLLFVSGMPGVDSRFSAKAEEQSYQMMNTMQVLPPLFGTMHIINLRLERFRKNYSPLSQELITALTESYMHKTQSLLYIHRQGMNAFSVCEHCKNIFRCPKSAHILSLQNDGIFRCTGCAYKTDAFPSCPHCGHLTFRHVGFGTERIEREVRKLFPGARIFRADAKTLRTMKDIEKFYEESSQGNIDILIGTQMVLKSHHLPKLALIGMIDADSLLSFADFRSDEKLFQILTRFQEEGQRKTVPLKVCVQTFHPESTFFQRVQSFDSTAFLEKIMTEREDLFYPPYSRLFAITCSEKTEQAVSKKMQKIYEDIVLLFSETKQKHRISISEKVKYLTTKKLFETSMIIRIASQDTLPDDVRSYLQKIDMTTTIDVDPLSFL
ncbi:MAG: primosomal protein N' [Candidatus Moranbacteria bacterium]|nr:primosomal protein N' [Candidatus Moranbacteria bacterium]PIV86155.1 MAG: primosomal protein N' [Candidatus Moranbacteria bacterium CG17_big_fil_post_rev_8_21_14_2_50_41_107]PIW94341.1 MAG: primosomal protein N' [Candidatus Moranbacteria bacterium CG_4_8_14_3_um_filter_41_13]PIX91602.1 MAG: primosomal protein N' [Candidatus Moranbacteria bacterium CG_4_10_14_3_um_filter_41_65]PJC00099.1 MAG: primosomal protein N' [Candidatus Moranbacteria bacterium CG_4_9_14_0_8_um_filter_41_43]